MRRYDEPVEVRGGLVDQVEGPEQFVWRDRLWRVRAVVGRWVETAPWWEHQAVRGLLGADHPTGPTGPTGQPDLPVASVATIVAAQEQEVWRVDATVGRLGLVRPDDREVRGVFDLAQDETGRWWLLGCLD